ncbi:MAG: hypothetical protein ACYS47_19420 [Planctomycetota bacterium]
MARFVFEYAALLTILVLCAAPAQAWERTAPPTSEGPPWGRDRYQHLAVRIGVEFANPVFGGSGGSAALYAPAYAEGWQGKVGGFADLSYFLCPGHALFIAGERFAFPSSGPETVVGGGGRKTTSSGTSPGPPWSSGGASTSPSTSRRNCGPAPAPPRPWAPSPMAGWGSARPSSRP